MKVKTKIVLFNQWLFLGKKKYFGLSTVPSLLCIPFSPSASDLIFLLMVYPFLLKSFESAFWIQKYSARAMQLSL
ncbi:hypothetical protein COZ60_01630 [Candidatus Bathyarchaeota archaeon CG_4_8_14_3_um_filter_42_8]|nr:MAG: hypothetical protein COZ60_01630 [Candidatus Bathyarchaeota archaeon CG_4_8_14_3_um_filter_42_8]